MSDPAGRTVGFPTAGAGGELHEPAASYRVFSEKDSSAEDASGVNPSDHNVLTDIPHGALSNTDASNEDYPIKNNSNENYSNENPSRKDFAQSTSDSYPDLAEAVPFIDKRPDSGNAADHLTLGDPADGTKPAQKRAGSFEQMDMDQMFSGTDFSYSEEDRRGDEKIFSEKNVRNIKLIGQIFRTYWIVEYKDKMLMIDQHAAHEKVNFERLMARLNAKQGQPVASQMVSPACILMLTGREEALYQEYSSYFHQMGYEIEDFGQGSYAIRGVPTELYGNKPDELIHDILGELEGQKLSGTPHSILYKIATMACKASVKGNMRVNEREARELIAELLSLDNPYHCPHGRPTMIELSKYEIERKFGRIV